MILRAAPEAVVVDLCHNVAAQDVRGGALILAAALPYTPPGVHLAVVDPGVGGGRRALALRTAAAERYLVGPDNGLLLAAAHRFGGVGAVVEISNAPVVADNPSPTFHGRDIFAPVAGALASGFPLARLGSRLDPSSLVQPAPPFLRCWSGGLECEAVLVDHYGNVSFAAGARELTAAGFGLGDQLTLELAGRRGGGVPVVLLRTYSEAGQGALLLHLDSRGFLALAANGGSASRLLGLRSGDRVTIRRLRAA